MLGVYLAAGWFNPEQRKQMDEIYEVLNQLRIENKIKLFSPFYDGIVLKKDDPNLKEKMKLVWDLDIKKVMESDLIVASTQDHDVGTIFECGYASAFDKTIFCYNSNPELGLNVMLAQEAKAFCKSKTQLRCAVIDFIHFLNSGEYIEKYRYNLFEGDPI